ncbi:hypothetical protein NFHSH190041_04750 [Shewanella sp. NFH-SH190041]|nr:hypothetical protein NFHSH190041_04750 [Shewanella sp. NFH-SH190041]
MKSSGKYFTLHHGLIADVISATAALNLAYLGNSFREALYKDVTLIGGGFDK